MTATKPISRKQVARLLNPKSVAVVGVSERPGTAGRNCIKTLDQTGYRGTIHVVSRNLDALDGRQAVRGVEDLPDGVDLIVLTVPGSQILATVKALVGKKVGGVMCFASGFAEVDEKGRKLQEEIAAIARADDIAFAGPNCLGVTNLLDHIQVTFADSQRPPPGESGLDVDILCQSGAMAGVIRLALASECIGFDYSVTTGNEAVLGLEDYLPFLIENDNSRIIVMMAEIIRRPQEFLKHAEAARKKKKPIVMLHLSRSDAARESAKTHTGANPGDYATMEAMLRSRDVVLVDSLDELIDTAVVLTHYPNPPGGGLGVTTDSGALKGFALDYCDALGQPMAPMNAKTRKALRETLPDFVPVSNPSDVTAQAIFDHGMYTRTVAAFMNEPKCGGVLASIMSNTPEMAIERTAYVADGKVDNGKPLLCTIMGGDQPVLPELKPGLAKQGIPFFKSPERALRAFARANAYGDALKRRRKAKVKVAAAKLPVKGSTLTDKQSKTVLKAAGVRVTGTATQKKASGGIALSVQARRDPLWGPVVTIGAGRKLAGILDGSCILPADATPDMITIALDSSPLKKLLSASGKREEADIVAFSDAVARIGALMKVTPEINAIDVDPLIVYPAGKGILAKSARLRKTDAKRMASSPNSIR